jgi:hypothetical protein
MTGEKIMKHKKYYLALVVLVLLTLLLSTSAVAADTPKSYFSGVEALGPPAGGTMKVVDGRVLVRGMVQPGYDTTSDPRTSGEVTIVVNAVWVPPALTGPMWGTFRIANDDGTWEGHWQGQRTLVDGDLISTIQGTAHGGGDYEGLVGKWTWSGVNPGPENPYLEISGYILEP